MNAFSWNFSLDRSTWSWLESIFHGSPGCVDQTSCCPICAVAMASQSLALSCPLMFPKPGPPTSHPFCDTRYSNDFSSSLKMSRCGFFHLWTRILPSNKHNSNTNYHYFYNDKLITIEHILSVYMS